ncbi:neurochondrin [Brienomyrus brachyistius]|uniref:neurochondrin n=1 Tax=Brienomyrus brachyistius TaxID=42636 RepID=UPI0020B3CD17|nr:neurochondrin [Brienomyrus brachyistius]XP_048850489.1 neurochondrin [Brienomyrus brachyistius]XP_048850490.1 neurochondrin [Brienomyrus brachyistius]
MEETPILGLDSSPQVEESEQESPGGPGGQGLSPGQREVLERCLHTLTHARNDSHTLAALLLITRLCPANQMDHATLRRVFEAVGLGLPARLLVTALRANSGAGLPPEELLSLGAALLAALSTDPDMATHPQLLSTVPLLLGLIANGLSSVPRDEGPAQTTQGAAEGHPSHTFHGKTSDLSKQNPNQVLKDEIKSGADQLKPRDSEQHNGSEEPIKAEGEESRSPASDLDEAVAIDCYQVLRAVCGSTHGPEKLLARGAVPALCSAVAQKRAQSRQRGLPLLGHLLSGPIKPKAWSKHRAELSSLLTSLADEFSQASDQRRLEMCALMTQFLPLPEGAPESEALKSVGSQLWVGLRPMIQSKVTPAQLGDILVLSACLLDLFGWAPVGPPKLCCLLVNRACVEVRMGLEVLPGTELSLDQQNILGACYRIMEAAMEQACCQEEGDELSEPRTAIAGLTLQQSKQVLGVLEEAFSAIIYYLQQVGAGRHGDPFVFATFRCLCAWLAEETSCLKDDIVALLPILIGYVRSQREAGGQAECLASWMSEMSVADGPQGRAWAAEGALRYLLPALCHLSAEETPRQVLLSQGVPALLADFLHRGWEASRGSGGKAGSRDPSMETACSALLNFVVTEPDYVREDPCFSSLQSFLNDAFPVALHKPQLLVMAANFCTLGLMIARLTQAPAGPAGTAQHRFFSVALGFLLGALSEPDPGPGQLRVSTAWQDWWHEVGQLWALALQAFGGCVRAEPGVARLARDGGWLAEVLGLLGSCPALPDSHIQGALEEALVALASHCPLCRADIASCMERSKGGSIMSMARLQRVLAH